MIWRETNQDFQLRYWGGCSVLESSSWLSSKTWCWITINQGRAWYEMKECNCDWRVVVNGKSHELTLKRKSNTRLWVPWRDYVFYTSVMGTHWGVTWFNSASKYSHCSVESDISISSEYSDFFSFKDLMDYCVVVKVEIVDIKKTA